MERIAINLDLPPEKRWDCLKPYKDEICILINTYLQDLEDASFFEDLIDYYKVAFIKEDYLKELAGIASFTPFSIDNLLIANLYYDALKLVFGCTAFAHFNGTDMLHARNLDWWSDNNSLSKFTKIFDFQKAGQTCFSSIGWPGFIGVLSGMRPKLFGITLNAAFSPEQAGMAPPITFLIRDVLATANSYEEAVKTLSDTPIASDCLLLVSGTTPKEKIVIERTPYQNELRVPDAENRLVVTNDYLKMSNQQIIGDLLQETSCKRYDQTMAHLLNAQSINENDCLEILSDPDIKMGITMQQMVFNINQGTIKIQLPWKK